MVQSMSRLNSFYDIIYDKPKVGLSNKMAPLRSSVLFAVSKIGSSICLSMIVF